MEVSRRLTFISVDTKISQANWVQQNKEEGKDQESI